MHKFIDLHLHTTASDGSMTPKEVLKLAIDNGLTAISITDHDTIGGTVEAMTLSELNQIEIIPGIEFSTEYESQLHILGYFININSKILNSTISKYNTHKVRELIKIFKILKGYGIDISFDEVRIKTGRINRENIAKVIIEKGYAENKEEVMSKFLKNIDKGYRTSPEVAIAAIRGSGGMAFLAHPNRTTNNLEKLDILVRQLISFGLNGIECYHPSFTLNEEKNFIQLAEKYNLLISGGSDFHGKFRPDIHIGIGNGSLNLDYEIVNSMKNYICKQNNIEFNHNLL